MSRTPFVGRGDLEQVGQTALAPRRVTRKIARSDSLG